MPLTLEQVRLTPYREITAIPAGFKITGDHNKSRKSPSPMQYNWYYRPDSVSHEIFHLLAMAPEEKPDGYTSDELKAKYDNDADKNKVDEIIAKFKNSWDHRHTGFDLVVDEATGTRYMLVWRDPRVHYAREMGFEGDFSAVPHQKLPSYVEKIPQQLAEAKAPKAVSTRAPRASKSKEAVAPTSTVPEGGFLLLYSKVPAHIDNVPGETVAQIFETAVATFITAEAMCVAPEDTMVTVRAELSKIADKTGLGSNQMIDFVARYQRDGAVKGGFYKLVKDMITQFEANKAAATPPAAVAEPTQVPVAAETPAPVAAAPVTEGAPAAAPIVEQPQPAAVA